MKQIDTNCAGALLSRTPFAGGNTVVKPRYGMEDFWQMHLHGNLIAVLAPDNSLYFTMAGWGSPTTRNRLNGLRIGVYQKDGKQMVGDQHIAATGWYRRIRRDECVLVGSWMLDYQYRNPPQEPPGKVLADNDYLAIGAKVIECMGIVARGGKVNTVFGAKTPVGLGASLVTWMNDIGYTVSVK